MMDFLKKAAVIFVVLTVSLTASDILGSRLIKPINTVPEKRDGIYGVFLTNGQVYFGTIAKEDDKSLNLSNIYYIQSKDGTSDQPANPSDVSLLKLGNELHGPEDWMEINRSNVQFIEKLKEDSKVAKAIKAYAQK
jgi:hypothetical protein